MVTNFVGIQKDFTVPCGVRADVGLRVKRADGSPAAVGRATWRFGIWRDGAEAVATRFCELLPAPDGAGEGDLFWRFPVLEAGLWRYELTARGSDGEVARVFYGVIGSAAASDIVADGEVVGVKGWRMLEVWLPEEAGGKVEAHWLSGDYVLALCEVARSAAGRAEAVVVELDKAVEEATGRAESAARRAEESATEAARCARDAGTAQGGAEEALRAVEKKFAGIDEVIERWNRRVSSAIYPSSETGTWVVGDYVTSAFWQGVPAHVGTSGNWMNWNLETQSWEDSGVRAEGKNGFSPYINALGLWVYFDPVTGQVVNGPAASGRDGLDGDAIVRHVVESVDDIPWSGDTCNGGHVYYVPKGEEVMTRQLATVRAGESVDRGTFLGDMGFSAMRSATRLGGVLLGFGLQAAGLQDGEPSDELLFAHVYYKEAGEWVYCGCSTGAVSQVAGAVSWWEFGELAIPQSNRAMRVLLSQQAVRADAEAAVEQVRAEVGRADADCFCGGLGSNVARAWWRVRTNSSEGFDVYSWVVLSDGSEGWVRTSAAYDLATSEVYGLMKYGTDELVRNGAPVGRNWAGQAFVPVAEFTVAGAVKPTNELVFDGGGGTHMTPDGGMRVDAATTLASGSVLLSFNGVVTTMCIGLTADGRASVPWATLTQEGVIKLGSRLDHVNSRPYIVGIGATVNHEIAFNVLTGGAMKHLQGQSGWRDGMAPGLDLSRLNGDSIFFGLDTSDSFSQAGGRLSLMEATGTLLGGVRVETTLGSASKVPTGKTVVDYLGEHYYDKTQVYSKTETASAIARELEKLVPLYSSRELEAYATIEWSREQFAPVGLGKTVEALSATVASNKTSADNSITALLNRVNALESTTEFVRVGNSGIKELWKGTRSEFAKLEKIRTDVSYDVLEN